MPTKVAAPQEKLFECEVKRRRVRASGGYEPFWKVKSVVDLMLDEDTEIRCKDCHGALRLHKRHTAGAISHVQHKLKSDSEFCEGSQVFREATDGRVARLSSNPVT